MPSSRNYRPEVESLARKLRGIVEVRTEARFVLCYSFDATGLRGKCDGVAYPRRLEDLVHITREAGERGLPLFVRGAGSGFSGGCVPKGGGLVVSMEHMNRVLHFDPCEMQVEVEAGMVNKELQDFLEEKGFFYPPDPASMNFSTIGGNIAENAGGPRALKYGVTRRYVKALSWVAPTGVFFEGSALSGPTSLLVGAEGTLGIVYSARLSVLPKPCFFRTSLIEIGEERGALAFAAQIIAGGLGPGVLEYIDSKTMQCVGEYCRLESSNNFSEWLLVEFDGAQESVSFEQNELLKMASKEGVVIRNARNQKERDFLWKLRRSVSPSLARRGVTKVNEDVTLPLGKMQEAARIVRNLASKLNLDCYVFGHAGDGNLHVNIMTDRRRTEEMARVKTFVELLFESVISLGGSLSGEHGIGITKSPYLRMSFSDTELSFFRDIKLAMDPQVFLNPGKYFLAGSGNDIRSGVKYRT